MTPRLEGAEMPLDTSFRVRAGQVLGFDFIRAGARGYLAIDGGIAVPEVLAAVRPTVWGDRWLAGTATGGGRPAAPGTCLALCRGGLGAAAFVAGGGRWRGELAGGSRALRSSPDPDAVERFFAETWTVGSEADRTGYRFKGGTALRFEPREQPFGAGSDPSNIVDACYPIGSIQVPGGLEPIVLHRDAVSGGDMPRWAR